jgi:predicted dinucleotide-binding enzyme
MTNHDTKLSRRRFMRAASAVGGLAMAGTLPFSVRAAAPSGGMKIGIIGSGNVGSNLGRVWASKGHEVMFSSRNLEHDKTLAAEIGSNARAGTPREAATFGEVIVLAVPYGALPDLGKTLADVMKGKVVIDTCNPFPQRDGEIATKAREMGAGRMSAQLLPGTRIVRAFNAVGAARMGAVHQTPGKIGMPIAGDDQDAIKIASRLVRDIGFEPVLIGGLEEGKYLMPGTPLAGEHSPQEIRRIAEKL